MSQLPTREQLAQQQDMYRRLGIPSNTPAPETMQQQQQGVQVDPSFMQKMLAMVNGEQPMFGVLQEEMEGAKQPTIGSSKPSNVPTDDGNVVQSNTNAYNQARASKAVSDPYFGSVYMMGLQDDARQSQKDYVDSLKASMLQQDKQNQAAGAMEKWKHQFENAHKYLPYGVNATTGLPEVNQGDVTQSIANTQNQVDIDNMNVLAQMQERFRVAGINVDLQTLADLMQPAFGPKPKLERVNPQNIGTMLPDELSRRMGADAQQQNAATNRMEALKPDPPRGDGRRNKKSDDEDEGSSDGRPRVMIGPDGRPRLGR